MVVVDVAPSQPAEMNDPEVTRDNTIAIAVPARTAPSPSEPTGVSSSEVTRERTTATAVASLTASAPPQPEEVSSCEVTRDNTTATEVAPRTALAPSHPEEVHSSEVTRDSTMATAVASRAASAPSEPPETSSSEATRESTTATAVASRTTSVPAVMSSSEGARSRTTAAAAASRTALAAPVALLAAAHVTEEQLQAWASETDFSETCVDDIYEYRRVTVPRAMQAAIAEGIPEERCMTEAEWRAFGITMSRGWQHYDKHTPESNVLLFRRIRGTDRRTGMAPPEMREKAEAREAYTREVEELRRRALEEKEKRLTQEIPDQY